MLEARSRRGLSGAGRAFAVGQRRSPGRLARIAIAAGGWALGCGGLAQDAAPGEPPPGANPSGTSGVTSGGMPAERPGGATPAVAGAAAADETCYSRSQLEATPGLEAIAPFLPPDAFDRRGCLAGEYSGWIEGDGCRYDPDGAVLRGDRCCYDLRVTAPGCGGR